MQLNYPLILKWFFFVGLSSAQWIDPHDMNTNYMENVPKPQRRNSETFTENCAKDDTALVLPYLKRMVSILKDSVVSQGNFYKGTLNINLNKEHYQVLSEFMSKDEETISADTLRDLDEVLSISTEKTVADTLLTYNEVFYHFIFETPVINCIVVIVVLLFVKHCLHQNYSTLRMFKNFLLGVYFCDYYCKYQYLKEVELKKNPNMCESWWNLFKSEIGLVDCQQQFVSPLDVIEHQMKTVIVAPMKHFGEGFGLLGRNLFWNLPFGLNLIMWPIMMVLALILFICLSGISFRLNILHLFSVDFGQRQTTQPQKIYVDLVNEHSRIQEVKQEENLNITSSSPKKPKSVQKIEAKLPEMVEDSHFSVQEDLSMKEENMSRKCDDLEKRVESLSKKVEHLAKNKDDCLEEAAGYSSDSESFVKLEKTSVGT